MVSLFFLICVLQAPPNGTTLIQGTLFSPALDIQPEVFNENLVELQTMKDGSLRLDLSQYKISRDDLHLLNGEVVKVEGTLEDADPFRIIRVKNIVCEVNYAKLTIAMQEFHDKCLKGLDKVCNKETLNLFNLMNSKEFQSREDATIELTAKHNWKMLLAGMHHKSAEVRWRCRVLLIEMYTCENCHGTGVCPQCKGEYPIEVCRFCLSYSGRCPACGYDHRGMKFDLKKVLDEIHP